MLACHFLLLVPPCDSQFLIEIPKGSSFAFLSLPRCSMYGIFTYIWLKSMVNVGKYCMHGAYGLWFKDKTLRQNHTHGKKNTLLFLRRPPRIDRSTQRPPPQLCRDPEIGISNFHINNWLVSHPIPHTAANYARLIFFFQQISGRFFFWF